MNTNDWLKGSNDLFEDKFYDETAEEKYSKEKQNYFSLMASKLFKPSKTGNDLGLGNFTKYVSQ